jgi:hypothetical protein
MATTSKTIAAGTTVSGFSFPSAGYTLTNLGVVGNTTTIAGVQSSFTTDSVVNAGSITGNPSTGFGVYLAQGGLVTNQSGGAISGGIGVQLKTAAATVVNAGSIGGNATSGIGVSLNSGGSVTNQGSGVISGAQGIQVKTSAGTIVNAGSIGANVTSGHGVYLTAGGSITNQSSATIGGYFGVKVVGASGTVVNAGSIAGNTTSGFGIVLLSGGSVTNQSGGTIGGYLGIQMNASGTVLNAGDISGNNNTTTGHGVFLVGGGSVTNQASGAISGFIGAEIYIAVGTLVNAGSISGNSISGIGVSLSAGGSVTNQGGDTISGATGVRITGGAGTVVNAGGIVGSGGTAVSLAAGQTNRVVFDPGATFTGTVSGGNTIGAATISTLELASAASVGTLSGLGSRYVNFARITVDSGASWQMTGSNTLAAGGSITNSGTLELNGASLSDAGALVNNGLLLLDPSTLTAAGLTGSGSVTIGAGGTLNAQGTVSIGETIDFAGANGLLIVGDPVHFGGTIAGFATNGTIDLHGLPFVPGSMSATVNSGGTLVATNGTITDHLILSGPVSGTLLPSSDGSGGTDIAVLCFCAGTGIATPAGEVSVERLAVGDEVLTASGVARRISWIGAGRLLATRGRRGAATPIIVRNGALADNVPHSDLHVTKGHALFLDGVLIPVEFLVNHRSIVWDDRAQEVAIYHVELETHDVLLANGAPAESYRDDGNRWLFANANTGWHLPPQEPCAPVMTGGPVVDAAWLRLLERTGPRPGLPLTEDPDLHLLVDGDRLDAASRHREAYLFELPARREPVRIVSRAAAPAELGVARDPRVLGVALRGIALRQGTRFGLIKASDARLADGFHVYESTGGLRWTDGGALLPASLFKGYSGALELLLYVCATTRYLADDGVHRAA